MPNSPRTIRKKKPKIEAIIFDIGRVIIDLDPSRAIAAIGAASTLAPDKLWHSVQKDPLWDRLAGRARDAARMVRKSYRALSHSYFVRRIPQRLE